MTVALDSRSARSQIDNGFYKNAWARHAVPLQNRCSATCFSSIVSDFLAARIAVGRSLDPLARSVFVVLALDRTPGDAVGAALVLPILVPGAVERFLINVLGVRRQVIAHALGKIGSILVWHLRLLNRD